MGYRQVVIRHSEKLNLRDNQLVVHTVDQKETTIPLEDISFILIEDVTTTITTQLLANLGKNAICLVVCDDNHEPASILYAYNYHYKQLELLEKQLALDSSMKDEIWQLVVKQKIQNEICVLENTSKDEKVIHKLYEYSESIEVGDVTNREGLAAKLYFRSLFGSEFIRFYDDAINSALNYAYTVVRSCFIRTLSIYGLLTYCGIHHCSKVNNFNLAYDLMEPYRAIVDRYVYERRTLLLSPLSYENRKSLVDVLNVSVLYEKKVCTLEYSIDLMVQSYVKLLTTGELVLSMPRVLYG